MTRRFGWKTNFIWRGGTSNAWLRSRRNSRALRCGERGAAAVAEQRLADVLVMGVAGLQLLRDGVHVAKTPFERIFAEYRGGARHAVGGVDHRNATVNRPGRGETDRDAVPGGHLAGLQVAPQRRRGGIEERARRAPVALGAADHRLHRVVVAHRFYSERGLAA